MAENKKSMQILRGTRDKINNSTQLLLPGQLLYNMTDNFISCGSSDNLNINKDPIAVKEIYNNSDKNLHMYFEENNTIIANKNENGRTIIITDNLNVWNNDYQNLISVYENGSVQVPKQAEADNEVVNLLTMKEYVAANSGSSGSGTTNVDLPLEKGSGGYNGFQQTGNTSSGGGAVALGVATVSAGDYGLTHGYQSKNIGSYGEAGGARCLNTATDGYCSGDSSRNMAVAGFVHGHYLNTDGSFEEGNESSELNLALPKGQAVFGSLNARNNNAIFIVGNGVGDDNTNPLYGRHNAFEVLKDGRATVQSEPTEDKDIVNLKFLKDTGIYETTPTPIDEGIDLGYIGATLLSWTTLKIVDFEGWTSVKNITTGTTYTPNDNNPYILWSQGNGVSGNARIYGAKAIGKSTILYKLGSTPYASSDPANNISWSNISFVQDVSKSTITHIYGTNTVTGIDGFIELPSTVEYVENLSGNILKLNRKSPMQLGGTLTFDKIVVPNKSVETYKLNWPQYADIIIGDEEYYLQIKLENYYTKNEIDEKDTNLNNTITEVSTELQTIMQSNYAKLEGGNTFTGEQHFENIVVNGNIIQQGEAYETHVEKVFTKDDYIIMREGAVAGLADNEYTGIQATKYDGVNDGRLVFDNTGTARVGDIGDEQPLATRAEATDLIDKSVMVWDAVNYKMVGGGLLSDYQKINDSTLETADKTIPGAINELRTNIIMNAEGINDTRDNILLIENAVHNILADHENTKIYLNTLSDSIDASLWNHSTTYSTIMYIGETINLETKSKDENGNIVITKIPFNQTALNNLDNFIALGGPVLQVNDLSNVTHNISVILPYAVQSLEEIKGKPIIANIVGTKQIIYAELDNDGIISGECVYLIDYAETSQNGVDKDIIAVHTSKVINFITYSDKAIWKKCVDQFTRLPKALVRVSPNIITSAQANICWEDGSKLEDGTLNHAPNFWANLMLTRLTSTSGLLSFMGSYHNLDGTSEDFNKGYNFSLKKIGDALGIKIITHSTNQEATGTWVASPMAKMFETTIGEDGRETIAGPFNYSVGAMLKMGLALNCGYKPYGSADANIPGYDWSNVGPSGIGARHLICVNNVYIEWE